MEDKFREQRTLPYNAEAVAGANLTANKVPSPQEGPAITSWVTITPLGAFLMSRTDGKIETVCHIPKADLGQYGLRAR